MVVMQAPRITGSVGAQMRIAPGGVEPVHVPVVEIGSGLRMSSQPKSSIQIWPLARPLTMSRQKAPQPISLIMIDPFHQQGVFLVVTSAGMDRAGGGDDQDH